MHLPIPSTPTVTAVAVKNLFAAFIRLSSNTRNMHANIKYIPYNVNIIWSIFFSGCFRAFPANFRGLPARVCERRKNVAAGRVRLRPYAVIEKAVMPRKYRTRFNLSAEFLQGTRTLPARATRNAPLMQLSEQPARSRESLIRSCESRARSRELLARSCEPRIKFYE